MWVFGKLPAAESSLHKHGAHWKLFREVYSIARIRQSLSEASRFSLVAHARRRFRVARAKMIGILFIGWVAFETVWFMLAFGFGSILLQSIYESVFLLGGLVTMTYLCLSIGVGLWVATTVARSVYRSWLATRIAEMLKGRLCHACDYDLAGVSESEGGIRCPECGEVACAEERAWGEEKKAQSRRGELTGMMYLS